MSSSTRGDAQSALPGEFDTRHMVKRLLELAVFLGVLVVAVLSFPGLGTLRDRFADANADSLALIGVLKLGSCLSNIVAFRDVFCPGMGWRFSFELGMAEQATNVLVPTGGAGGLALGAWALRQGGMSTEHIGRRSVAFFVLTSVPNFLCAAVLGPLLLTGLFDGRVPFVPTLVFSVLAWAAVLFTIVLPRLLPDRPQATGRSWANRLRRGLAIGADGIRDVGEIIRARRWAAILGAIGYLAFDIAALIVAFSAFGGTPPLGPLIFAYVIGQLGGLIPLPAGIGGTDGGLIGAMVLFGSPLAQAAAAVLAYRAFQLCVPAIIGTISFVGLRRELSRVSEPAGACSPLAAER
jgi:uncharacterized membrane protein YbhN (UPF0104 family)